MTRARLALAVLTLPALLVALDLSVLLVALPRLAEDLHADAAQQLWITDVYGFLVAGFLVTMGSLGDRIGRRHLLLIGAAAFGAASLAAAFAPTPELLIAARAALGVAGATLMPSALALVTSLYPDPRRQGMAVATVFSAIMVGGALGPALGGLLLEHFWWGSVFLPGVAVMVLLLAVGPRLLPEGRGTGVGRLDPASVALSLLALLPVVHAVKAVARGDLGASTVVALVVGVAAGTAFVRRQRRLEHPLLDLRLLAHPALRGALGTMLLGGVVMGGMFLVVTQDLQLVAGLDPLTAGLATLPGTVAMLVGVLAGPVLARRVRPAWVMAGGTALTAVGLAGVALAAPAGTVPMIAAFTVALFGMGLPGGLGVGLVVGSAPAAQAGSASSLSETGQELGMAVGLAGMGSLAVAVYRTLLPADVPAAAREGLAGAVTSADPDVLGPARDAFTSAVSVTAAVAAVLLLAVSALVVATLRHVPVTPAAEPALV
ncbi:DHA2 family multidrug resistance protein-like MFS transporter [Actinomycetospora succinea]|uniref:DHA2 family multidrug resistance protein-like MFS transporter n=1 Tax=Actinomycetospora succinea TaxID=663603 RepID=A0A4R6UWE1_9PSEU|nr:MFS transporter [Actinomycetospora succinea]TDQ51680.1 DHA2 family multidrug resistance protein-like MFS transporter [Actinomycetospora succinea]